MKTREVLNLSGELSWLLVSIEDRKKTGMTSRPDEPLNGGDTCDELIYLLDSRAPVYIHLGINKRVAKIMAKSFMEKILPYKAEIFCQRRSTMIWISVSLPYFKQV